MGARIAVIDYAKGNLKSVQRGVTAVGGDAFITDDPHAIAQADALVLPGVGAFADASASMAASGQDVAVVAAIEAGKPFLGICLGLHLLFSEGVEGAPEGGPNPRGLGVIEGVVDRIPNHDGAGTFYKVPHVGWNTVEPVAGCAMPLLEGVKLGEYFYFTHSYKAPASSYTQATTTHSVTFPSAVQVGENVFGVQFHPEKSSDAGLRVLANFLRVVNEG